MKKKKKSKTLKNYVPQIPPGRGYVPHCPKNPLTYPRVRNYVPQSTTAIIYFNIPKLRRNDAKQRGARFDWSAKTVAEKFERIVEVGGGIAQTSTIRWNFSAAAAPNIANHIPILKPCMVAFECGEARLNLLHGYHVMAAGAQTASGPSNGH